MPEAEIIIEDVDPIDDDAPLRGARQLEKECQIIITRGGTAIQIGPKVAVPVIELPITFADVLNTLYWARNKGKQVMVVTHTSQDHDLGPWPEVLGITVTKVLCNYRQEIREMVKKAKELGAVVVGGTLPVEYAALINAPSCLILSGYESVFQCLQKAVEIIKATHKERERSAHLQALLDFAHEGIIFLEESGRVGYVNSAAVDILKAPREQLLGKEIAGVFNKAAGRGSLEGIYPAPGNKPLVGKVIKLDNLSVIANIVPVNVEDQFIGTVVTFFEASRLQSIEYNLRRQLTRRAMTAKFTVTDIVGRSKAVDCLKRQVEVFAATDSTVLIYGESGVGKELFAQSIHQLSWRRRGTFVPMNCSALPKELVESELFGYEEGAFTGARKGGKEGLFELAHGGTIFLDEIGTMPLELQSKILRVIQEKEVTRLGGDGLIPVDVRIIVATNSDLKQAVMRGEFRQDLFYRLNVLPLYIPPLRERTEDIPELFEHFVRSFSRKINQRIDLGGMRSIPFLREHRWPGNVRELMNFCERFVAVASHHPDRDGLLTQLLQDSRQEFSPDDGPPLAKEGSWKDSWQELERIFLEKMLAESSLTKSALARSLGISRTALWKKLKKD
ncbi:MAG: hypothetical protein VR68_13220 [Peptococcaceae bacterium BRH_c4a]|nr:MAG: hypothetical protein VR68_13220 [Peptococcaceae bacterium BRH_c4a]